MAKFTVGDPVWVYDAPRAPAEGVVSEINALGLSSCVRVLIAGERVAKDSTYGEWKVFARPAQLSRLIGAMRDDADFLERAADRLEQAPALTTPGAP
jgi:hypothetical protein